MNFHRMTSVLLALAWYAAIPAQAQQQARVDSFSPQGEVRGARQVTARFSEAMIPFGDPRVVVEPFVLTCPEKGTGRWIDTRNWSYDFDRDLPAGVSCEFTVRPGLKSLDGREIRGKTNLETGSRKLPVSSFSERRPRRWSQNF